jgi:hypothetical protein
MLYLVFKGHTTGGHDLLALGALGGKLFLEAAHAVDVRLVGDDEGLGPHLSLANHTLEALVVPLSGLVLHLFHSYKINLMRIKDKYTWWNPEEKVQKLELFGLGDAG